jgi:hypothetical protein
MAIGLLELLRSRISKKMNTTKSNYKQQILNDVQMDTQTTFMAGGDINIHVCPWELDKAPVTANGKPIVRYRAGVMVVDEGRMVVKRVREGLKGPKYEVIYQTAHADVKRTREMNHGQRGCLKVEFRFPRRYPLSLMKSLFYKESEEIMAYFHSRKEETVW